VSFFAGDSIFKGVYSSSLDSLDDDIFLKIHGVKNADN